MHKLLPDLSKFATVEVVKEQASDVRAFIFEVANPITSQTSSTVASVCKDSLVKIAEKLKAFHSEHEDTRFYRRMLVADFRSWKN